VKAISSDRPRRHRFVALTLALLSAGAAVQAQEESVRPGINDKYRKVEKAGDVQEWVERFEREGREVYDHRRKIVQQLRVTKGMTVADIGSGTGLFVNLLGDLVGADGTVIAVDIIPQFLERIQEQAQKRKATNVKTLLCTDRSARLPKASVDRVFICDTYHHFEYPESTMKSIYEALKDDGLLLVVDFERIEGKSSDFILGHVRAGKEVFLAEIVAAGFELVEEADFLEDNYLLLFRKRIVAPSAEPKRAQY
jgi:ubiquinone/menaquinone biosynthesis C-methylase UbiE